MRNPNERSPFFAARNLTFLRDGHLDYSLETLQQMEVVIASVHGRMKMDSEAMTSRLISAMRQPCFKIWGHALGRLLLHRPAFACDVDRI